MPPEAAADGVGAVVETDVGAGGVTPSDPPWVDWVAGGCLAECYGEDEVDPNVGRGRGSHVVGLPAGAGLAALALLPVEAEAEGGGGEGGVAQVFAAASFDGGVDGQVVVAVVVAVVAPMDG